MSPAGARLALACSLWAAACGEPRLLGIACPGEGCEVAGPPLPVACGARFATEVESVEPGEILDRCELFTIDALAAAGGQGEVYLTHAQAHLTPLSQHLEVRLAPEIGFMDGEVPCEELYMRAVPWIPMMTTQEGGDTWDLSSAPLIAAASHRLLINHQMVNSTGRPVDVSVVLQVECADTRPAIVSQAFEFSDRQYVQVSKGQSEEVSNACVFDKDVLVSRLYRRTHLISGFTVHALRGAADDELLWNSGLDWTLDLEPPLEVAKDEGFRWACTYENPDDVPFEVGGDSPDACALLGFYRLPDGGVDDKPERCTR